MTCKVKVQGGGMIGGKYEWKGIYVCTLEI